MIKKRPLTEYTDKELQDFLEENHSMTALELGGICSEILRRNNIFQRQGVFIINNTWIKIEERVPEKGNLILYCAMTEYVCAVGIYWNNENDPLGPVPSRPYWLPWHSVTHWMLIPCLK